jgi:Tol biopolymer transport system component
MQPNWSPDGSKIAFTRLDYYSYYDAEIWIMNPNGSAPQNVSNNSAWDAWPDWMP